MLVTRVFLSVVLSQKVALGLYANNGYGYGYGFYPHLLLNNADENNDVNYIVNGDQNKLGGYGHAQQVGGGISTIGTGAQQVGSSLFPGQQQQYGANPGFNYWPYYLTKDDGLQGDFNVVINGHNNVVGGVGDFQDVRGGISSLGGGNQQVGIPSERNGNRLNPAGEQPVNNRRQGRGGREAFPQQGNGSLRGTNAQAELLPEKNLPEESALIVQLSEQLDEIQQLLSQPQEETRLGQRKQNQDDVEVQIVKLGTDLNELLGGFEGVKGGVDGDDFDATLQRLQLDIQELEQAATAADETKQLTIQNSVLVEIDQSLADLQERMEELEQQKNRAQPDPQPAPRHENVNAEAEPFVTQTASELVSLEQRLVQVKDEAQEVQRQLDETIAMKHEDEELIIQLAEGFDELREELSQLQAGEDKVDTLVASIQQLQLQVQARGGADQGLDKGQLNAEGVSVLVGLDQGLGGLEQTAARLANEVRRRKGLEPGTSQPELAQLQPPVLEVSEVEGQVPPSEGVQPQRTEGVQPQRAEEPSETVQGGQGNGIGDFLRSGEGNELQNGRRRRSVGGEGGGN